MSLKRVKWIPDFLYFLLGGLLYSIGVMIFITPSQISPGGVTGVSALLSDFIGLSTGTWVLILNVPLVIWGIVRLGVKFIGKTAAATIINSVILDVFGAFAPKYSGDKLLAAIFGGIFIGAGLAAVILRGATTGGIDIAAKIINRRYPHHSMGRLMLMIDALIVIIAAVVYRNAETALYSVVALFASSYVMDSLLYGADRGKLVFIVTEQAQKISESIFNNAHRGVTEIETKGGYTRSKRTMLMCAARRSDVSAVVSAARLCDERAFIVVAEAGEILGEGFHKRIKD